VGDLASGAHRRIMIRLAADAAPEGARPVANVVLAYEDARGSDEEEYQGALSVAAVADAGQVASAQRPEVVEAFTTAEAAQVRAEAARRPIGAIMPKLTVVGDAFAILMPWDPDYAAAEGGALPGEPPKDPRPDLPSRIMVRGGV
ncbi:MAG: hypothetical protein KC933_38155, partial [Myxococcales bacterium]|nr:hypothetical protein [Myxococcales bacterium]